MSKEKQNLKSNTDRPIGYEPVILFFLKLWIIGVVTVSFFKFLGRQKRL